jgi:hypothetical protein
MDTVPSKAPEGYHPLHYQSKAYDECTNSLRAFNQDQREFLELYRWLRHVTEFFKSGRLFAVINNAKAQNEIEKSYRTLSLTMKELAVQTLAHCAN